ncbi:MAG: ribonuclease III, partial [Armatimonadetes bacterium]|nr:ribonuclease III [Armatimonadota bacterium]
MTNDSRLDELQERLGVRFKDIDTLKRALTHRSAVSDVPHESNERLEFLGDAIIGMMVCEQLLELFPDYTEGQLAKTKAYVVSESALAPIAREIGLDKCVILNPSEAASGGRNRPSILSDAFEALIAALYLDSGFE